MAKPPHRKDKPLKAALLDRPTVSNRLTYSKEKIEELASRKQYRSKMSTIRCEDGHTAALQTYSPPPTSKSKCPIPGCKARVSEVK